MYRFAARPGAKCLYLVLNLDNIEVYLINCMYNSDQTNDDLKKCSVWHSYAVFFTKPGGICNCNRALVTVSEFDSSARNLRLPVGDLQESVREHSIGQAYDTS